MPPSGAGEQGALVPYEALVPYSKWQSLTPTPFGLTEPFTVAVAVVRPDAAASSTVGGGSRAVVITVASLVALLPALLRATSR